MKITVTSDSGEIREAELYSPEGLELVSELWIKSSFQHRVMYEPTWLGIPVIQFPSDVVMMQELIWKLCPDVIIETGVAHGGGTIFYASLLELMGKGKVIGIDVEIRKHNRLAIQGHPLSKRIELVEGSSTDSKIVEQVKNMLPNEGSVLVTLDSNHSYKHVLNELEIYSELIAPGGYLVVMDTAQEMLSTTPAGKDEWADDNPLAAVREFILKNKEWEVDGYYTRTHITCNPSGFLRRKEG
jgi:cephalosporin hydroxylase